MISEANLKKFKELYKQKYGVDLTEQQAFDIFSKYLQIVEIVYFK